MNRLFGTSATKAARTVANEAKLDATIKSNEALASDYESQIDVLEAKKRPLLIRLSEMRKANRQGTQSYQRLVDEVNQLNQRIQRKRAVAKQTTGLTDNLEMLRMTRASLDNVQLTMDVMKHSTKQLERQLRDVDIDKIERQQDKFSELMDLSNEIQETLGRSYEVPDELDEADLDAELEALQEEMLFEQREAQSESLPGFLQDEVPPEFIDETPATLTKAKEAAT